MNLPAKKSLGQHWLEDKQILRSICDAAEVSPEDNVLEVGPGHGTLTRILLDRAASVVAVEFDEDLAAKLPKSIKSDKLKVVHSDILSFDLTTLSADYKVVANIPYYLTSNLIRTLCESSNPPTSIILLVQKEVAERVCARPGSMSLLSVSAQSYYECNLGPVVTSDKFSPPPKVDSQVAIMHRSATPLFEGISSKEFFQVVKAGFSSRRKTLLNSLSGGLDMTKDDTAKLLQEQGVDPTSRPQELSVTQWVDLAKYLTR
ncbi:MAG TPA: 16S rRNA (adenine(1518)-N(6)/adenine(1519)-N(6))-dimethyltransferase RsmA [Patescibacteria group bacterium]|nr:16S rRNA (adenine(1518)-N(6)/adenine(1519)-N(6))-dimethyltransferase RsmA [Patescibacteria group bacterium]